MPEIGITATSAYVPGSSRSLHSLLGEKPPQAEGRTARLLQACFEENLQMHGVSLGQIDAVRLRAAPASLAESLGLEGAAEEQEQEISGMLLTVVRQLLACAGVDAGRPVSTFLVCQTSLERDVTLSAACRLQSELQQGRTPFAIGQQQGATFLIALSVAADLMTTSDDHDKIVIAGAERWSWPYLRLVGRTALLGDGAGAVLLERGCQRGWVLRAVKLKTPPPAIDIFRHMVQDDPFHLDVDALCDLIRETLQAAGRTPSEVTLLVPHCISRDTGETVRRRCGMDQAWCGPADIQDGGYLCAAETPVRLHRLLQLAPHREGELLLAWGLGFGGALACALLEYVDEGAAHAPA